MIDLRNKIKRKDAEAEVNGISPSFRSHSFTPNSLSFSFSSHAQEIFRCDIPEEGKGTGKERRNEEKKVKSNGKRGRGKGATE